MSNTELSVEGGMHIEPDPKTGAIAASNTGTVEAQAAIAAKDDQPEQTPQAEAEQPQEPIDPRKAIMDKIYANRGEQFKRELEYAAAVSQGATVEPILDEASDPQEPVIEPVQAKEQKAAPQQKEEVLPEPQKRLINVGNQQFNLTEDEIAQLAQRTLYAEQQVRQPVYQQQPQQQVQQQAPQVVEPNRDQLKDIARRITYGSEEESAKALGDFAGVVTNLARQAPGPSPVEIANYAAAQAVAQNRFERNLETISSEYADIYQSRAKTLIAADHVGNLRQKYNLLGIQKPDLDIWREACSAARDDFGVKPEAAEIVDKTKQPAQLVASVGTTRLERKRAAPQPAAAVNKVQAMAPVNQYPTGSAVVQAMRKSRGQPSSA